MPSHHVHANLIWQIADLLRGPYGPPYTELQAARLLVDAARREGEGHNYLTEHSAGSGKSNTSAGGPSAGFLTRPTEPAGLRSVIVVTHRVVLDQQLQDTIYPIEHKRGVVQKIDERSRQLAEGVRNAVPVIITTLQKFPSSRDNCSSSPKGGARAAPARCRRGVAP